MKSSINALALSAAMVFSVAASAQTHLSNLEAAELAIHRVGKLVQIKKIDADFETKLKGLSVVNLKPEKETDPYFKSTAFQYPAEDKTVKAVNIWQDHMGKATKYEKVEGGDATGYPEWPKADPLTFFENGMHYVEVNAEKMEELMPYKMGLRTISLEPGKDADNKDVAIIRIAVDKEKDKDDLQLLITLDLEGKAVSHKIEKVEKDEE